MADKETLVTEVKAVQRSGLEAKQAWWDYADGSLGGVRDPNRHDGTVLQDFLNMYRGGTLPRPVAPAAMPHPHAHHVGMAGMAHHYPGVVAGLGVPGALAGHGYTASMAAGHGYMASPALAAAAHAHAHAHAAVAPPTGATALADFVKTGQRHSQSWKNAWQNYCTNYGTGRFDPAGYEPHFIKGFIDFLGSLAGGNEPVGEGVSSTVPMGVKRPAMADVGPVAKRPAVVSADPEKQALVDKVKGLQRSGIEAKTAWWAFCDNNMGGVRDPCRHEPETLKAFLADYGM